MLSQSVTYTTPTNIISDPQNPQNPRIHQYIERMMRSKSEIFDDMPKKRGPPEPTDGLDPAKRQKLAAPLPAPPKFNVPSLSPGPHTVAELFTVTTDDALKAFDVALLPEHLVVKIGISLLQRLDANVLSQAVEVSRFTFIVKPC
jgi:symplekin